MIGIFIVIWLICAIAGSVIGDKKGHKVLGALLGFFLGLIGVLIISLWSNNRQA